MRNFTPEQKQNRLRIQKEYRDRNKEAIKKYKDAYYLKNKEQINAKRKVNKDKTGQSDELVISKEKASLKVPLFTVLDALRKYPKHYLNSKEIINWSEKDINEFKKLTLTTTPHFSQCG